MTTFSNLKIDETGKVIEIKKDPLDLIVKNKDFVRHLRKNGIDGLEINKILGNLQGLKQEWPIGITEKDKENRRKIDYAMRHVKALATSDAITDEELEYLCKIMTRLYREYIPWEKNKKGHPVITFKLGQGDVKTPKQVWGKQTVALYGYIQKYNSNFEMFLQKDVFLLIAELFDVRENLKFTRKQIENFYKNNS